MSYMLYTNAIPLSIYIDTMLVTSALKIRQYIDTMLVTSALKIRQTTLNGGGILEQRFKA